MTDEEKLYERYPLPWTHQVLMIRDARGNEVVHLGSLIKEPDIIKTMCTLIIETANSRARCAACGNYLPPGQTEIYYPKTGARYHIRCESKVPKTDTSMKIKSFQALQELLLDYGS